MTEEMEVLRPDLPRAAGSRSVLFDFDGTPVADPARAGRKS